MNPFFFGTSERPLFGIYHPPKGTDRGIGIVICPPMAHEYSRTHRALRQLALQLTRAGFHALRFDYYGTGDSGGDDVAAGLDGWQADLGTAIEELKDTAGVRKTSLIGVRFGATLAFQGSMRRTDVEDVVLWDPVVNGRDYVAELLAMRDLPDPSSTRPPEPGPIGVGGFALTPAFQAELETLDLTVAGRHSAKRLFLVVSEEREDYSALLTRLQGVGNRCSYRHIPSGGDWADAEQVGAALLPQAIIQGIVAGLTSESD